ncbi:uncharacterized protein BO87DRAFT_379195 [Aspergillus neoniger CBS 115656]|uniref:Metalloprotease m41 ftsh n=1 Tax=Aspergillus neoniger (strain CBS 115656) TaxID=1448310 RepID=A0A318YBW2_ASPNB|nr:hypothetical protein BO87DRAFT_379195 [Aspergillus neoniger CBS 115656]PYH31037.1 hypothetical protein BO87DRAFT_379195 [Aspergillus neoniger CBS 115656]
MGTCPERLCMISASQRARAAEKRADVAEASADTAIQKAHAVIQSAEEDKRRAQEYEKKARKELEQLREELEVERERSRRTTFGELLQYCHTIFSAPLGVEKLTSCTEVETLQSKGKFCPLKLELWESCDTEQEKIYRAVRMCLEPPGSAAFRLFTSRLGLKSMGEYFDRPISSERDVAALGQFTVESQVQKILAEFCNIAAARAEFRLGSGVRFDSHANCLDDVEADKQQDRTADGKDEELSNCQHLRPEQYCIYQVDGENNKLIMTVGYKPPHILHVENIRLGLRPMEFWKEILNAKTIPNDLEKKIEYDAAFLTGSAIVHAYHVMIRKGLEYSYVSTGLALIMLRVPYDSPGTLYYRLFEPNSEITPQDDKRLTAPLTSVARVLGLCLMSCSSTLRDQKWRDTAKRDLPIWPASFNTTPFRATQTELNASPAALRNSYTATVEDTSAETSTTCQPSQFSIMSPTEDCRMPTPTRMRRHLTPDADTNTGPMRQKRRISENAEPSGIQKNLKTRENDSQKDTAQFCTQRCFLGLQYGRSLDEQCPNVALHRLGTNGDHHQILPGTLVRKIEKQLNKEVGHGCTSISGCASTGPLFKITSSTPGYTMVGKGASCDLWKEKVSREADIYRILHQAQGSAVPVVLGTVDLKMTYFSHEADINHMLLMAWGGEQIENCEDKSFKREVKRSEKEIRSLGVIHHNIQPQNTLWNPELRRALIIDFDRSQLDSLPIDKRQFLMGKKIRDPSGRKRPSSVPLE